MIGLWWLLVRSDGLSKVARRSGDRAKTDRRDALSGGASPVQEPFARSTALSSYTAHCEEAQTGCHGARRPISLLLLSKRPQLELLAIDFSFLH